MEKDISLLNAIKTGIQEKKGKKIITADLKGIETASTDYFVICEGNSSTQVDAIADNIYDYVLKNLGIKPFAFDGYQNAQWIVLDYGNIWVHIFQPEIREFYNLEKLWNDAKLSEIPDAE